VDRFVLVPLTPNPGFKVTVYLQSYYRTLIGNHTVCRMVPHSMTVSGLWPRFQGHNIFWHWISQKRQDRASVTIERQ